ncbi:MAG: hypothetical protein Q9224_003735 [Gallowayella concinna]
MQAAQLGYKITERDYVKSIDLCDEIRKSYLLHIGKDGGDPRLPPNISLSEAILFWKACLIKVIIFSMIGNAAWIYRDNLTLLPAAIQKRVLKEVFGEDMPGALQYGKFELLLYLIVEEFFRAFHHQEKGEDAKPYFVTWSEDLDALKNGPGS